MSDGNGLDRVGIVMIRAPETISGWRAALIIDGLELPPEERSGVSGSFPAELALALVSLLASLDLISRQTAGRPDDAPEITADEIRAQVVPATLFRSSRAAIMALITELVKLHSANEHALKREGPRAN